MNSRKETISYSPMMEGYRESKGLPISPTHSEIELCEKLKKIENCRAGSFIIERLDGSVWDVWNVYLNGINIFCFCETTEGYSIRFCYNEDVWIEKLLTLI